jgi:hypothetical protein
VPEYEIEYIHVALSYGEEYYIIHIGWFSETVSIPIPPEGTLTIPAATILVHDVKLIQTHFSLFLDVSPKTRKNRAYTENRELKPMFKPNPRIANLRNTLCSSNNEQI